MRPAYEPSGLNSELWFQDERRLGSHSPPFGQHQTPRTSSSSSLRSPLSTRARERSDPGIRSALGLPLAPPRQGPSSQGRPFLGRSRSSEYDGRQTRLPQTLLPSTTYPRPLRIRDQSPSPAGQDPATTSRRSTSPRPSRHADLKLPSQTQADDASGSRSAPSSVRHVAEEDSSRRPRSRSPRPTSQQGSPSSRSGNASTTQRRTFDDDTDVSLFAEALSGIAAGPMTEPLHQSAFSPYNPNDERMERPGPPSPSPSFLATYQPRHPYLSPATYAPAAISVPALHTVTTPSVHVISPLTPDMPFTPRSHPTPHPRSQSQHNSRSASRHQPSHYHNDHTRSADYTPNIPFTHTPSRIRAPPATTTASSPSASLHEAMLGLSANALPTFHPHLDDDFDPLSDRIYDNDGLDLSDDELPSYEQSQRETAEKTRRMASSRAAELESRWAASSFAYR